MGQPSSTVLMTLCYGTGIKVQHKNCVTSPCCFSHSSVLNTQVNFADSHQMLASSRSGLSPFLFQSCKLLPYSYISVDFANEGLFVSFCFLFCYVETNVKKKKKDAPQTQGHEFDFTIEILRISHQTKWSHISAFKITRRV